MLKRTEMESFFDKIVCNLQVVNPLQIILFGSYAKGRVDEESDIDLVVILDLDLIPKTYDQKLALKVQVRESIYELSRQKPIDLTIYTRGEFEHLKKNRTSFYNEIMDTGKLLYEKAI